MTITFGPRVEIDSAEIVDSDAGGYLTINNGKHTAAALVVVRYVDDEEDSRDLRAFADLLVSAEELADALELVIDLYDVAGMPPVSKARRNAEAVLRKIGRRS